MLWREVIVTLWEGVNVMWEGVKVLFCKGLIVMVAVLFIDMEDGLTWAVDVKFCTIEEWFCVALPFAITAGLEVLTLFPLLSTKTTKRKWHKAKIHRGYYMVAWRYKISLRVLKNISRVALTREIFFQNEKRTFVSPRGHVMFYLLCKHQWNTKPFHLNSFLVWKAPLIM